MNETAPVATGRLESLSALGLMVGGGAAVLVTGLALALGLRLADIEWWLALLPLWGLVALPLGWRLRRRSAPSGLRTLGRLWLIAAAVPLVILLGMGKPMQKAMMESQKVEAAK